MKFVRLFGKGIIYFAVATVIAQSVWLAVLMAKGPVTKDKIYKSLAVMYDIEDYPLVSMTSEDNKTIQVFPSLEEVEEQRTIQRLNLVLRETSVDKGLSDMLFLDERLNTDVDAFNRIKGRFDTAIQQREKTALNEGIQQVRRNVEVMRPKQAKDTLVRIINEDAGGMAEAATIIKAMSPDKRKKILSAFKSPAEEDLLYELLDLILIGDTQLIDEAQKELNEQFRSKAL